MKRIKIKPYNVEFALPMSLEECTVDFFVKFAKLSQMDELTIISELSGLTTQQIYNLEASNLDEEIFSALYWWEGVDKINKYKVPGYITIEGISYEIPKNLRNYTLGQQLEIKALLAEIQEDSITSFFDVIKPAFAVYFDKIVKCSREEMIEKTGNLKIIEVYPIVNFFLSKLLKLSKNGITL